MNLVLNTKAKEIIVDFIKGEESVNNVKLGIHITKDLPQHFPPAKQEERS